MKYLIAAALVAGALLSVSAAQAHRHWHHHHHHAMMMDRGRMDDSRRH